MSDALIQGKLFDIKPGQRFEFATATRIIFGGGSLEQAAPAAAQMGNRALVITGSTPERAAPLLESLSTQGISYATYAITSEPTIDVVNQGLAQAREATCDIVIAIGGGSVIDAGKAIAALLTNPGHPLDYLEVVGKGQSLTHTPAPFIAIPTTAGTGAEVTRNAVLTVPEKRVKVSLRSPAMLPRLAVVDPELTHSLPPHITATTGLDALTQVIEPYVSHKANPLTDALCREGIRRAARSLKHVYEHGDDAQAREDMALTSLLGGLALANAKLGAVHGFAGPMGGMFPAPHGAICGRLLPHVMAVNIQALKERQPGSEALTRYAHVAQLLTGDPQATTREGIAWIDALCQTLNVPPFAIYGITADDFPLLIEKASASSSMKGNPIQLLPQELEEILNRAL